MFLIAKGGQKHESENNIFIHLNAPNSFKHQYFFSGFAQYTTDTQLGLPEGAKARLGKGSVEEGTYSPDVALLAVGSNIGIWLYDTKTYRELALLAGRMDWVYSLSFSPDSKTIASGGGDMDCTVRLWDVETRTVKVTLTGHTSRIGSLAFSRDGTILASASV